MTEPLLQTETLTAIWRSELPGSRSIPILYYPGANPEGGRDGIIVEIQITNGPTWIGIFGFDPNPVNFSGLFPWPEDETSVCVVSKGFGYVVNGVDPTDWFELKCSSVLGMHFIPQSKILTGHSFTDIYAWGTDGLLWERRGFAMDDLLVEVIDGDIIRGHMRDLATLDDREFALDLRTGNEIY